MPDGASVLAEGDNLDCLRRDLLAALTVAIVALPLSMAIAIASGVSPEVEDLTFSIGAGRGFAMAIAAFDRFFGRVDGSL
jgi:MFS superfamily sulfate permease-like transporter